MSIQGSMLDARCSATPLSSLWSPRLLQLAYHFILFPSVDKAPITVHHLPFTTQQMPWLWISMTDDWWLMMSRWLIDYPYQYVGFLVAVLHFRDAQCTIRWKTISMVRLQPAISKPNWQGRPDPTIHSIWVLFLESKCLSMIVPYLSVYHLS